MPQRSPDQPDRTAGRNARPAETAARAIDARGLSCPLPVLKLRKALLAMTPGARVVLTATDPLAAIDVPHFCREAGHRLIETRREEEALVFVIERGSLRPEG